MNRILYEILLRNLENDYSQYVNKHIDYNNIGLFSKSRWIKIKVISYMMRLLSIYKLYDRFNTNLLTCIEYNNILAYLNVVFNKNYTWDFCAEVMGNSSQWEGNTLEVELYGYNTLVTSTTTTTTTTSSTTTGTTTPSTSTSPTTTGVITLVSIDITDTSIDVNEGDDYIVSVIAIYSDSSFANITPDSWNTTDAGVATGSGLTITGIGGGTATLTASYTEGGITKTDTVEVNVIANTTTTTSTSTTATTSTSSTTSTSTSTSTSTTPTTSTSTSTSTSTTTSSTTTVAPIGGCKNCLNYTELDADYCCVDGSSGEFNFSTGVTDTPFSISAHITFGDTSVGIAGYIATNKVSTDAGWQFIAGLGAGINMALLLYSSANFDYIVGEASTYITTGQTKIITATYDGSGIVSGIKIYYDGVLETMVGTTNGSYSTMNNTNNKMVIGSYNADYNRYTINNSVIKDFRVWNVALTAGEVSSVVTEYNSTNTIQNSALITQRLIG